MAKIRKPYEKHERVQVDTGDSSFVQQSSRDEADINNIMAKYRETGLVTYVKDRQGQFMDLSSAPDYHTAMNVISEAVQMFDGLSSDIRKHFGNDPGNLLEALDDEERRPELERLGVLLPKSEVQVTEPLPPGEGEGGEPGQGEAQPPA